MTMPVDPPRIESPHLVNRWGPWLLAGCGLALLATAAYHRQHYATLDAEIDRKLLELKQGQEALRRVAAEAGKNPASGMLNAFALFGSSPEVNALAVEREHHYVRFLQFGGPGGALFVVGLCWAWVVRRLRWTATSAPDRVTVVLAIATFLVGVAATALLYLHLRASSVSLDEAGPALVPWWLAATIGNGFAVYLARPRSRSVYLFVAVLTVLATSIGVLYAHSSDVVGILLGFATSTAEQKWYIGASVAVALTAVVFLWLSLSQLGRCALPERT